MWRRVRADQNIVWGVVTERKLPKIIVANLERLAGYRDLADRIAPERINLVEREHAAWSDAALRELCSEVDTRLGA